MERLDGTKLLEQRYVNLGRDDAELSESDFEILKKKYGEFETIEGVCYGFPKSKLENSPKGF